MAKVLVTFFSRADENYYPGGIHAVAMGNTACLAHALAEVIKKQYHHEVTVFEVKSDHHYSRNYHECTHEAQELARKNFRPNLIGDINVRSFDVILVGFPIWWGTMPMDLKAFLEKHSSDFAGKKVLPFCTHEGSRFEHSLSDLKEMLPQAHILKGLDLYGHVAQDKAQLDKALGSKGQVFLAQLN